MAMWLRDKRYQGLFIALPGVNNHAKGFYRENCEGKSEITVRLLQEDEVLEAVFQTQTVVQPDVISRTIEKQMRTPGDWLLLYTDKGLFWVQCIIPQGGGIPSEIALFDAVGNSLSDRATREYLTHLYPELNDLKKIVIGSSIVLQPSNIPQDVEETARLSIQTLF